MLYKINKDAYHLSSICDEILTSLNYKGTEDPIEVILKCIKANKELAEIEKFYLNLSACSVTVEFQLKNCDERFVVEFTCVYGIYKAKVLTPYILITQPLHTSLEGLVYCSPYQHILYVDYFTNWVPLDDGDRCLDVPALIDEHCTYIDDQKRQRFFSFYKRLNSKERENLYIANIDMWDIASRESENARFLLQKIANEDITCVVSGTKEAFEQIEALLPPNVSIFKQTEKIPLLSKRQWTYRAVNQMQVELPFLNSLEKRMELPKWVRRLMIDYNIPERVCYDTCLELLDKEDMTILDGIWKYSMNSQLLKTFMRGNDV